MEKVINAWHFILRQFVWHCNKLTTAKRKNMNKRKENPFRFHFTVINNMSIIFTDSEKCLWSIVCNLNLSMCLMQYQLNCATGLFFHSLVHIYFVNDFLPIKKKKRSRRKKSNSEEEKEKWRYVIIVTIFNDSLHKKMAFEETTESINIEILVHASNIFSLSREHLLHSHIQIIFIFSFQKLQYECFYQHSQ